MAAKNDDFDQQITASIEERKQRWPSGVDPYACARGISLYDYERSPDGDVALREFTCFDDARMWALQWLEFLANPATWQDHNDEREAAIRKVRQDLGWWVSHFEVEGIRPESDSHSLSELVDWLEHWSPDGQMSRRQKRDGGRPRKPTGLTSFIERKIVEAWNSGHYRGKGRGYQALANEFGTTKEVVARLVDKARKPKKGESSHG